MTDENTARRSKELTAFFSAVLLDDRHEGRLREVHAVVGVPPAATDRVIKALAPAESEEARQARLRSEQLAALGQTAMEEWSVEQSVSWACLGADLPAGAAGAVRRSFDDEEIDGEELVGMTLKRLQKLLKRGGAGEGEALDVPALAQSLLELLLKHPKLPLKPLPH